MWGRGWRSGRSGKASVPPDSPRTCQMSATANPPATPSPFPKIKDSTFIPLVVSLLKPIEFINSPGEIWHADGTSGERNDGQEVRGRGGRGGGREGGAGWHPQVVRTGRWERRGEQGRGRSERRKLAAALGSMLCRSCSDLTRVALGRAGGARGNWGRRRLGKGGEQGKREEERGKAREDFA